MFGIFTTAHFRITLEPPTKGDIPDPYLMVLSLKKREPPNTSYREGKNPHIPSLHKLSGFSFFFFFWQVCDEDTLG
jgi:hypothetical protein